MQKIVINNTEIKKYNFHFIAIGGIGMSGLAKYLLENGYEVSGSDIKDSKYLKQLKDLNAKIFIGHNKNNLPKNKNTIVVVSSAIKDNNQELIEAKNLGYKIFHRSDLLEFISRNFVESKDSIFIGFSGTHGKTTSSGLCSYILEKAKLNPSFSVGGIIPELNVNAKFAGNKFFIAELDESDGSIVKYSPDINVINNLEADHLDFYKNGLDSLLQTFSSYLVNLKESSKVIINNDNIGNLKLIELNKNKIKNFITFGLNKADYMAINIDYEGFGSSFDVIKDDQILGKIKLSIPGEHNVYNALGVISACIESGIDFNEIVQYFQSFTGMGRRFQKTAKFNDITIIDDYAHHPSEIKATLKSIEKYNKGRKIVIFQPHRYSRLKSLWKDFQQCFINSDIDILFITDVYAASEEPISDINSKAFQEVLKENGVNAIYVNGSIEENSKQIFNYLKQNDLVLTCGAGDITQLGGYLLLEFKLKNERARV